MAARANNAAGVQLLVPAIDPTVMVYEHGAFRFLSNDEIVASGSVPSSMVLSQLNVIRQRIGPERFRELYVVGVQYTEELGGDIQIGITESMMVRNQLSYTETKRRGKKEEIQIINRRPNLNILIVPPHYDVHWYVRYMKNSHLYPNRQEYYHNNTYVPYTAEERAPVYSDPNNTRTKKSWYYDNWSA